METTIMGFFFSCLEGSGYLGGGRHQGLRSRAFYGKDCENRGLLFFDATDFDVFSEFFAFNPKPKGPSIQTVEDLGPRAFLYKYFTLGPDYPLVRAVQMLAPVQAWNPKKGLTKTAGR